MKLILMALLVLSADAFAAPLCEVYGISDSPQVLNCLFKNEKVSISCKAGVYYVGNEIVEGAYHLEVEEGPTPLVFRTKTGELTVTMSSGRKHGASLTRHGKKLTGNCRL